MRQINLEDVRRLLPPDWEQEAKQALSEVQALPPDARAQAIKDKDVWRRLKSTLAQVSYGKCWYCESKEIRSDTAVDHFRPKNSVAECPNHDGYWWLAFEWQNYRLSCTYCNSRRVDQVNATTGGKQDHFPLVHEDKRAYSPNDDLNHEEPELLDPTNPFDPGLLWFDPDGAAVPKYSDKASIPYRRAEKSRELYHLNHVNIQERRLEVCNRVRRLVEDGDKYLQECLADAEVAKHGLTRTIEVLREMIGKEAAYSSTARAMLLGYKDRDWIDMVFVAE